MKVHFMGIGGSGISAAALLAKAQGFKVTGCDLLESTPYLDKVVASGVKVSFGHSENHLKDTDILAVTPSALFINLKHPEITKAQKLKKLITWQKFIGEYLQRDKKVICISGTHGKSTTTAIASLVFEKAGLNPWVELGATVKEWSSNFRVGRSNFFINEADEFFDNFLNYTPQAIILNNIEMDHPDYFKSEKALFASFAKFVKRLKGEKVLIVNADDEGVQKLLCDLGKKFLNSVRLIGYSLTQKTKFVTINVLKAEIIKMSRNKTQFHVKSESLGIDDNFVLSIPGSFNVSNALGVIALSRIYKINTDIIQKTLESFRGVVRRLELLGTRKGVMVYDDYAHHPTAISATIQALAQKHPHKKIWVVLEPHSFSRTQTLLRFYKNSFKGAYGVCVGPIFPARDTKTYGLTGESIVKASNHPNARYLKNCEKIVSFINKNTKRGDIVVTMGAGESHLWAKEILRS